jgi:hypothetical protein
MQKRRIRDYGLRYGKLGNSHAPVVPKTVNFFLLKLCPYLLVDLIINDIVESISFDNDILDGGSENDVWDDQRNDNTLVGGPGADTFHCGPRADTIKDFNEAEGDTKSLDCENF